MNHVTVAEESKRARKKHVQQLLFRRGGKRRGTGRKPTGTRSGERHVARPDFKSRHPVHVVMRVVPAVGSLRRRAMYKAVRWASVTALVRERFRIVHISLQRTHIHMIVEAKDKVALVRGMQGFMISAARLINTELGRSAQRTGTGVARSLGGGISRPANGALTRAHRRGRDVPSSGGHAARRPRGSSAR